MKAKFPGFKKCMAMMRSRRDPQTREDGFHWLRPRASEYVEQLIREYDHETDSGLRYWLLELGGEARSPAAFEFLAEHLRSDSWRVRKRAIIGLKYLDTKQARTLLWQARSFELDAEEATERLRVQLESPDAWWLD